MPMTNIITSNQMLICKNEITTIGVVDAQGKIVNKKQVIFIFVLNGCQPMQWYIDIDKNLQFGC